MNALALNVVIIVEAGEERMRSGDPCGRLSRTISVLARHNSQTLNALTLPLATVSWPHAAGAAAVTRQVSITASLPVAMEVSMAH